MADQKTTANNSGQSSDSRETAQDANLSALRDASAGDGRLIAKPPAGVSDVISVRDGEKLSFGFSLKDVSVDLVDVDLILTFRDGAKIILLEFGLQIMSEIPPDMVFDGMPTDAQELVSRLGTVSINEDHSEINFSTAQAKNEADKDKSSESEEQAEAAEPVVEVIEVEAEQFSSPDSAKAKGQTKGTGSAEEERARIDENLAISDEERTRLADDAAPSTPSITNDFTGFGDFDTP
ncbi:MAG: hypothetical protein L3J67_10755, partial [Hyphomicrobiaceae bacterium]|nr:hypothetical protein [Hyphomicrobiaceae bacterium]